MMKKISLLSITLLTLAASQAHALHDLYGWYVSADAGYANIGLDDITITSNLLGENTQLVKSNERRGGVAGNVSVGYGLQNFPVRFEVEGGTQSSITYRQPALVGYDNGNPQDFSSKVYNWHVLANAIFDFHLSPKVTPYFKAGVGISQNTSKLEDSFFDYTGNVCGGCYYTESSTDHRFSPAWQVGVGSAFKITNDFYAKAELTHISLGNVDYSRFYQGAYKISSSNFQSNEVVGGLIWYFDAGNRYTAPSKA